MKLLAIAKFKHFFFLKKKIKYFYLKKVTDQ